MFPKKFLQRIESFLTEDDFHTTIEGYNSDRVCSFRINAIKSTEEEVESYLYSKNISFQKVSFLSLAYTIDQKDEFTLKGSYLFYEGKIYVQGITSQLPAILLDIKNGITVLDITAAPGSKTTQIATLMKNTGKIIACEKHQIRYDKLLHNIKLQGATNIETHKIDALEFLSEGEKESFDTILLDAPCSAEGRFKSKEERSYGFWTIQNIRDKAVLQANLLEASIPLLKKGGVLIYSTCTLAPEENEGVISDVLNRHPDLHTEIINIGDLPLVRAGIGDFEGKIYNTGVLNTIRILPSSLTEGFYIAKIRKI